MTNRQWLESLSDEEFESNTCGSCDQCIFNKDNKQCDTLKCTLGRMAWLKEEHKEQ